jgi:hypothetical protein
MIGSSERVLPEVSLRLDTVDLNPLVPGVYATSCRRCQ